MPPRSKQRMQNSGSSKMSGWLLFSPFRWKGKSWEVNREGGAFSRAGVDVQRAFGLFDEALDNAQAEPRALTLRLGREVWLKDFGQKFWRNAGPIVTHRHRQKRARVFESFHVEQPIMRSVFAGLQVERLQH